MGARVSMPKEKMVVRRCARRHEVSRRHERDQQDKPEARAVKHAELHWPLLLSPSRLRRGKVLR